MFDSKREEMTPLPGIGDPTGTGAVRQKASIAGGAAQQFNLDHGKRTTVIRYQDKLIEADVYAIEGEPLKVVIICPRCNGAGNGNATSIDETRKAIDWRPHAPQAVGEFMNCGSISIDAFECPWELPDAGAHNQRATGGIIGLSAKLCRLKIGVLNNIAKDA